WVDGEPAVWAWAHTRPRTGRPTGCPRPRGGRPLRPGGEPRLPVGGNDEGLPCGDRGERRGCEEAPGSRPELEPLAAARVRNGPAARDERSANGARVIPGGGRRALHLGHRGVVRGPAGA